MRCIGQEAQRGHGAEPSADIDWRTFLTTIHKPAHPITPIPGATPIPSEIDADAVNDIGSDGRALGLRNISTLRFRSGRIVVIPPKESNVVNSVVNFGGVIDADSFGELESGGTVLVPSPR